MRMKFQFRKPAGYADPDFIALSEKWNPIITAFMKDLLLELKKKFTEPGQEEEFSLWASGPAA
jgi:hypothetical protein